jgi:hypothetical protein
MTWQTRMWIDDMFHDYCCTGAGVIVQQAILFILIRAAREMVLVSRYLQKENGTFFIMPLMFPFFGAVADGWMAVGMSELLRSHS